MSMHDNFTESPSPHTSHQSPQYAVLISAIMFILFATLLSLALCYIRMLPQQDSRNPRINSTRNAAAADFTGATSSSCHPNGILKPEVLASLPVFTYPLMPHGEKLECAVCLSEFREGEKGRVLPRCRHSFHTECIDMWLDSHFTCPLCRVSIQFESPDSAV